MKKFPLLLGPLLAALLCASTAGAQQAFRSGGKAISTPVNSPEPLTIAALASGAAAAGGYVAHRRKKRRQAR